MNPKSQSMVPFWVYDSFGVSLYAAIELAKYISPDFLFCV